MVRFATAQHLPTGTSLAVLALALSQRKAHNAVVRACRFPPIALVLRFVRHIGRVAIAPGASCAASALVRPLIATVRGRWVVGMAALLAATASSEGARRAIVFDTQILPMWAEYRYTQWRVLRLSAPERHREYELLHDKYAVLPLSSLDARGVTLPRHPWSLLTWQVRRAAAAHRAAPRRLLREDRAGLLVVWRRGRAASVRRLAGGAPARLAGAPTSLVRARRHRARAGRLGRDALLKL
jgi:hypothetical protein